MADYENGEMHLASFALIMNAAIELIEHNEKRILDEVALRVSEISSLFLRSFTLSDLSMEGPLVPLLTERHSSMNDATMEEDDRLLVQYMMAVFREQVRPSSRFTSITNQSPDRSSTV